MTTSRSRTTALRGAALKPLSLSVRPERFAVCRVGPEAAVRESLRGCPFWSVTRTGDEVSVVLPQDRAPADWQIEPGWRCIQVRGQLAFEEVGVLASLTTPLANAGISVFALSTYETDYLLVKELDLHRACETLTAAGHTIDASTRQEEGT